jgi:hypothetical protein
MASGPGPKGSQNHRVGEHWSGGNPIPTIHQFLGHIDADKKERDRQIDEQNRVKKEQAARSKAEGKSGKKPEQDGDAVDHTARKVSEAKMRTVTDPTTGKDIGVEDQDESSMEAAKNPMVCDIVNNNQSGI